MGRGVRPPMAGCTCTKTPFQFSSSPCGYVLRPFGRLPVPLVLLSGPWGVLWVSLGCLWESPGGSQGNPMDAPYGTGSLAASTCWQGASMRFPPRFRAPFGAAWGCSGGVSGAPWGVLMRSEGILGRLLGGLGVLGRSWEAPETDEVFLERLGRVLGGSWGDFGALWSALGWS